MKSMAELAQELGISKQALYQRMTRAGIKVDTLTVEKAEGKSKFYSDESIAVVKALFTKSTDQSREEQLTKELETLKHEHDELINTVDKQAQRIAELEADKENWKKALDQAQQLHAMTLKALPAPKAGFFARLFGKKE